MNLHYHHLSGLDGKTEDVRIAMRNLWPDKCFESGYISSHPLYEKTRAAVRENPDRPPSQALETVYTFTAAAQRLGVMVTLGVIDVVTASPRRHLITLELLLEHQRAIQHLVTGWAHHQVALALARAEGTLRALQETRTFATDVPDGLMRRWKQTEPPRGWIALSDLDKNLFRVASGNTDRPCAEHPEFPTSQSVYSLLMYCGVDRKTLISSAERLIAKYFS